MATITHANYSNLPSFAATTAREFAEAAVLPNSEVMSACLRRGGKRSHPVEVALLADADERSAYRVGGEFGELIVIDATTGEWATYDLGSSDPDDEAAVATILGELGVAV